MVRTATTITVITTVLGVASSTAPNLLVDGVADVTKFAAKGDGATSDYAAVKAAAAAVEKAGGGTLLFPVKSGALFSADASPCPPSPCPGHANKTFCSSDPASGQCSAPARKAPCPPCATPNAGMRTGYVTGAFNISSNMRVEIEPGVHLLGSKDGNDWPLIVVDTVWPGFGFARDADPVQGRLMHQALIFTYNTTNVSVGGGGTVDCRGSGFQACSNDLSHSPCNGYARPQCIWFSTATRAVLEDITVRPTLLSKAAPLDADRAFSCRFSTPQIGRPTSPLWTTSV